MEGKIMVQNSRRANDLGLVPGHGMPELRIGRIKGVPKCRLMLIPHDDCTSCIYYEDTSSQRPRLTWKLCYGN